MPITPNGLDNDEGDDNYYDGDEDSDDEPGECPACHAEVYLIADRCPKCGHWFLEVERRSMARGSDRRWGNVVKAVSVVLLAAIAVGIISAVVAN